MKTVSISFCGGHIESIVEHSDKHAVLENIRLCVGLTADQKYYKVLRDAGDAGALGFPHLLTTLSAGHKYWLFLTQVQHENCCVLIERHIRNGWVYPKMVVPLLDFDDALHAGTLFEAEIAPLDDGKRHVMLLADLLMYKNRNTREWDPLRRFSTMHSAISGSFRENIVNQPMALQVKRLFARTQWREMLAFQRALPYTTRGLVLFPMNPRSRTRLWLDARGELAQDWAPPASDAGGGRGRGRGRGRDQSGGRGRGQGGGRGHGRNDRGARDIAAPATPTAAAGAPPPPSLTAPSDDDSRASMAVKEWLRWQPDERVDALRWCFQLERTSQDEIYNAFLQIDGQMRYYDIVQVPTLEHSKELRAAFERDDTVTRVRTKCAYDRRYHKWYPVEVACDAPVHNVLRRALFASA